MFLCRGLLKSYTKVPGARVRAKGVKGSSSIVTACFQGEVEVTTERHEPIEAPLPGDEKGGDEDDYFDDGSGDAAKRAERRAEEAMHRGETGDAASGSAAAAGGGAGGGAGAGAGAGGAETRTAAGGRVRITTTTTTTKTL